MAVGREQRRIERRERVQAHFGDGEVESALDLLELLEIGWHDCYNEITPSESIVDDVLVVSNGTLAGLIASVRLALTDWRDLKVSATEIRHSS